MMRFFLTAVVGALAVCRVFATAPSYVNYSTVVSPPVIDATNVVNYGAFDFYTSVPFEFSNVRNYTNYGVMANGFDAGDGGAVGGLDGDPSVKVWPGYRFDNAPSTNGSRRPAASFYNGARANNYVSNASIQAGSFLLISATNVVNRGLLQVGEHGLLRIEGRNLDLARGAILGGDFSERQSLRPEGIFDTGWASATHEFFPDFTISAGSSAPYNYTQFVYPSTGATRGNMFPVALDPAAVITSSQMLRTNRFETNRSVQIVFVRNTNPEITTEIRFAPNLSDDPDYASYALGTPIVTWSAVVTNFLGQAVTNSLYLVDGLGVGGQTNTFITNYPYSSVPPQNAALAPLTLQPANYSILRAAPLIYALGVTNVPFDPTVTVENYWSSNAQPERISANYTAYYAELKETTSDPFTVTNLRSTSGRLEINASGKLDLSYATLSCMNFLSIQATNHFNGATNARVSAPYLDLVLASTNGSLSVPKLMDASLPRFTGTIGCYSAKWSNTLSLTMEVELPEGGTTNEVVPVYVDYHVLFVDSALSISVRPQLLDLSLKGANVTVDDIFTVLDNLNLDADRLTILTNGGILVVKPDILWENSASHLYAFTNFGSLDMSLCIGDLNFVARKSNGTERPYGSFVNYGSIIAPSMRVSATNIIAGGSLETMFGPVQLQAVSNIVMDASFVQPMASDLTVSCRNLFMTNLDLVGGRSLILSVTNKVVDGGGNFAEVQNGFALLTKPASGDFLGTWIYDNGFDSAEVLHSWAARDLGPVAAGFTNNAALGGLTLAGGPDTLFTFSGTGTSNALYVDWIEFIGDAARTNEAGDFVALNVNPGMKIYFSQAYANGNDVTASLSGKNGGTFVQVSRPVEPVSMPIQVAESAALTVSIQTSPTPRSLISWNTPPGAISYLYYLDPDSGKDWQLMTNFVSTAGGRVSHTDPGLRGSRFYRVRVDKP